MVDLDTINAYMARVTETETVVHKPVSDKLKVGVDLGTAYIVIVVLDEDNNPVACEKQFAQVLKDGVIVDYAGACGKAVGKYTRIRRYERRILRDGNTEEGYKK